MLCFTCLLSPAYALCTSEQLPIYYLSLREVLRAGIRVVNSTTILQKDVMKLRDEKLERKAREIQAFIDDVRL